MTDVYAITTAGMRNLATGEVVDGDEPPAGALLPAAGLFPSATLIPAGA